MPEILPGEFLLTGTIFELIGATSGGDPTEALSALTGLELKLTSNIPSGRPIRREDGVFFVPPRTVTVLDDGQISEDGENPGIALLGDDPGLGFNGTLQWTITPGKATIGGKSVKPISWTFYAPEPGSEYTLGEVAPVLSLSATQLGFAPTIDNVELNGDNELQFYVGATAVGDPVSLSALFAADGVEIVSRKGQANGYVPLNGSGLIDSNYLPSYVDDVLEYANFGSFPGSGATGKVYVAIDTGDAYRWSGSAYVRISDRVTAAGITDSTSTGRALVTAADAAAAKTALNLTKSDVGLSNVDNTSDATKNAASAALTNKDLSSGTNTFPTFNQNTTGSAATLTTARTFRTNLASTSTASFNGSADATPGVTGTLPVGNGGTGVATLTGIAKGNGTSAFTAATAGTDYLAPGGALGTPSSGTLTNCTFPTLNQNTTGSAATLTTGRTFQTDLASGSAVSFNGSANNSHGVTGTLPVGNGGSGATTLTGLLVGNGTSAFTAVTAPSGTVVGTSDAQVLSNKTLTSPVISNTSGTALTFGNVTATPTTAPVMVSMGGTYGSNTAGSYGNIKLALYDNGASNSNRWGFSVESARLGYHVGASSIHAFYVNGAEAFRVASSGAQVGGVDVVTTSGSQNLTNKTLTTPVVDSFKDSNGNTVLGFSATASAVNYLQVQNSTASSVRLSAVGTDSNIGMRFYTKANASFGFFSDTYGQAFSVTPAASGVNLVQVIAGPTTVAPQVIATGTDANIDLVLNGTGTGVVKAGGTGASATVVTRDNTLTLANKTLTTPVIGSIKDSNGNTILGLNPQSGASDYISIWNDTGGPTIGAVGSSANNHIYLQPKGTGQLKLYVPTGQTPTLNGTGPDTNHNFNLTAKGTGVIQANGVAVATISGAQTITNKTVDTSNTVSMRDDRLSICANGAPTQIIKFDVSQMWAGTSYVQLPMNSSYTTKLWGGSGTAPSTASSDGVAGQVEWDSSFIYVCTATNTWKRAALSTW